MVTLITEVPTRYETNIALIKQYEEELNDIEHEIELSLPKNARQGYELYRILRDLRQKRRQAKDENEALQGIYEFCIANGNGLKSKLQSIQGNYRKLINAHQLRTYHPKRRNDLTITTEKPRTTSMDDMIKNWKQSTSRR
jgi:hypothetical protein